jgi:hypothetical protein
LKQRFFVFEKAALKRTEGQKPHKKEGNGVALTPKRRRQVQKLANQERTVRISGRVHAHEPEEEKIPPPALRIDKLKVVEESKKESAKEERRSRG